MESNWAAEHLQVIRTLMERSAVYRRALGPVMIFNGSLGTIAAIIGWAGEINSPAGFIVYWAVIGLLAMGGSFFLVRRQAIMASEPFWSPPTRRVTHAMLPPLIAGAIISIVVLIEFTSLERRTLQAAVLPGLIAMLWLPEAWIVLYGCAFHAAGFFMPRGMRLFGWAFIIGGCALFARGIPNPNISRFAFSHGVMGFFFGVLHLAYGIYLLFTEKRRDET
jgi:hypothetical protein